ncbi:DUF4236 domain-containing protein [Pseudoflavonifractor phocaeensis]|uniref:DUF4236 domain-containing protein n=1 Tax=Pseudoflavonifractor phocaeensis TaxID=1870988 RepID=UPI0019579A7F|nr:DUF4236 domain-containing protein [Pseudoflavonifractor phocaeensis]MBM6870785.1 DUF4236 domain-containing protein [Pseudoflavonifractor phocaeensis]
MGIRFRKSVKVAPGIRINVGKKSSGISIGNKYGGISVNSKTGARSRVSAPGTGFSYSAKIGRKRGSKTCNSASSDTQTQNHDLYKDRWAFALLTIVFVTFSILLAVSKISTVLCISTFVLAVICGILTLVSFYQYWSLEETDELENPAHEVGGVDDDAAQAASTQRLTLFLDAQSLSSLNLDAFMEYSNMVQETASAVMNGSDADSDYADALTNELSLIRSEASARSIALKAHNSKHKEKKECASQTSDSAKARWVFLMATPLFLVGAILCAIGNLTIVSIAMFIMASVCGSFAVISFYRHGSLEETDEPDDDEA